MKLPIRLLAAVTVALLLLSACESLGEFGNVGASFAADAGLISGEQADAISAAAESVEKAFETLTPEQEYYVGRAVAANLLQIYDPLMSNQANTYLNELGQSLAMASDKPYTFKGYRFMVLDSDEINAFATPGGFILVTRGMLECAVDEGTLAAVLAHEIGHVQLDHGIKAIKASRWTDAITKTAMAGVSMKSQELAEVTQAFSGSISDITNTLVVSGYSKDQEEKADAAAAEILFRVGYDPDDIVRMLEEMDRRWDPDGHDFAATHPSPRQRIRELEKTLDDLSSPDVRNLPVRDARYAAAFSGI